MQTLEFLLLIAIICTPTSTLIVSRFVLAKVNSEFLLVSAFCFCLIVVVCFSVCLFVCLCIVHTFDLTLESFTVVLAFDIEV